MDPGSPLPGKALLIFKTTISIYHLYVFFLLRIFISLNPLLIL